MSQPVKFKSCKPVEVSKNDLIKSFHAWENDSKRIEANRLSRRFVSWYLVTLDGLVWETRAHLPEVFVQAALYMNGKVAKVYVCVEQ